MQRITSSDQQNEQINIKEINHLSDQEQAERIADKFYSIPNEYEALKMEDIIIPPFNAKDIPQFHLSQVWLHLTQLKTNKATVPGDFPAKLTKEFALYIAEPLTDIINTAVRRGEYLKLYIFKNCTPVSKSYPPKISAEVRNISGLFTFDKIMEKLIFKLIISDMRDNIDPSQYGNQKGVCQ